MRSFLSKYKSKKKAFQSWKFIFSVTCVYFLYVTHKSISTNIIVKRRPRNQFLLGAVLCRVIFCLHYFVIVGQWYRFKRGFYIAPFLNYEQFLTGSDLMWYTVLHIYWPLFYLCRLINFVYSKYPFVHSMDVLY